MKKKKVQIGRDPSNKKKKKHKGQSVIIEQLRGEVKAANCGKEFHRASVSGTCKRRHRKIIVQILVL